MDLGSSIWLSSVAGALLFFSGGRLWGKAAGKRGGPDPHVAGDVGDEAARVHAEQEAIAAQHACVEMSLALDAGLARATALEGQLSLAEERIDEVSGELAVARVRAVDGAKLGTENDALRRHVEALSRQASEIEELRARVRDLTARGPAPDVPPAVPARDPPRPKAGQRLEQAIEGRLDELRARRGACQIAVLADVRGLLLASCGDATHEEALAAAVAMFTETSERVRDLLPLGDPLEIRLMDVNRAVLTARWLRLDDQDRFLVGTLGTTKEKGDPRADAIEASISDLLRAP